MLICKHVLLSLIQTLFLSDTSESPPGLPISHNAEHSAQWQNSLQSWTGAIGPFFILSGWRSATNLWVKVIWNVCYWNMLFPVDWLSIGGPVPCIFVEEGGVLKERNRGIEDFVYFSGSSLYDLCYLPPPSSSWMMGPIIHPNINWWMTILTLNQMEYAELCC